MLYAAVEALGSLPSVALSSSAAVRLYLRPRRVLKSKMELIEKVKKFLI